MKNISIKKLFKTKVLGNTVIFITSIVLVYLLCSIYFTNHFFFNTTINGVDVSLKAYDDVAYLIRSYIKGYELELIERGDWIEKITGQDIGMQYNEESDISKVYHMQSSYKWGISLFKGQKYYVADLFVYNKDNLDSKINGLDCLHKDILEPQNVRFRYLDGSYEVIEEVYGNKIYKDRLSEAIILSILKGEMKLDLNEKNCYENPKYILSSEKTLETKNLLNKYVKAKITYVFGNKNEILDGNTINQWLSVDEDLQIEINKKAVAEYVKNLSKKYDTVGAARRFKTSIGKTIEVKGGLYGWKINRTAETEALLEYIKLGEIVEKEPTYAQRALSREGNEIGNTYVEINITRQHLWFYKNGRIITHGAVVTGNPNRGYATKLGTFMLNYKDEGSTLKGPGYEAEVTYWMPFYGNIGIHDATWRYSFGGDIYKSRGSHGCINAPLYLAKRIFENIEEGTPIVCYEEESEDSALDKADKSNK